MDQICSYARQNCTFQEEIDSLEEQVKALTEVLSSTGICWADYIGLDIVRSKLVDRIDILKWQKEINKRHMSNVLVQALSKK